MSTSHFNYSKTAILIKTAIIILHIMYLFKTCPKDCRHSLGPHLLCHANPQCESQAHTHTHTHTHSVRVQEHTHTHIYIYTHTHTYIHIHTHTHTHTHT